MLNYIRIDGNSMVPKYIQIINSIIDNVSSGNIKIGDKIPSINTLSQEFYLSRDTVERAYNILKKKNVVVSVRGRGTYIAQADLVRDKKILFLVNKLSPYKMKVYNAFVDAIGDNCQVDIHSFHCDQALFVELMGKYKSAYDYFVILPHFRTENLSYTGFTEEVNNAINGIPKEQLVLLDNNNHQLPGDFIEVYQDFENDIFTALETGHEKISKYDKLNLVCPRKTFYPYPTKILDGFRKYCSFNNLHFEILEEISMEFEVAPKNLYITIEEEDLVKVISRIRKNGFKLGSDVGVISYNDAPLKQVSNITVITTDFEDIGIRAAKMILESRIEKEKVAFRFIDRGSA
ncbi:GntR family transcriptional regulator [Hyunsoonleella sp. SJ7]|uniref:GntR family transcriptional regulator n=1 Tax=Hyunsoonleella aquatilis TaxID=2762758 RepID=A0A923HEE8_9FLAO|nr:GntR family transcriptional regulator [Hyunsoonleella aquatilis]MBC3758713.1 GntR family transcriptional regulator [Hyunsoonleella aquatilis]